jgi:hypothetical protein
MVVILVLLAPGGLSEFKDASSPSRSSTVGVDAAILSTERIAYPQDGGACYAQRWSRSINDDLLVNGLRRARCDHSDQSRYCDVLEQLLCLAGSLFGCESNGNTTDRLSM